MNKHARQKVWKIFRFEERFELPDDSRFCRKGPLLFTRDYVGSGADDESIGYAQQMNSLRLRPNRLQLKGAFHDLLGIAANRSRKYRGYLLDENLRPASLKKISLWLGINERECKKIMGEIEEVGMIIQVEMPDFGNTNKGKKSRGGTRNIGESRACSRKLEKKHQYKGKDKGKDKSKRESGSRVNRKRNKSGNCNSKDNPNPKEKGKIKQKPQHSSGKEPKPKPKPEPESAASPPTTPKGKKPNPNPNPNPMNPTKPDGGAGKNQAVAGKLDAMYDQTGHQFALDVFRTLGIQPRADSNADSEVASWQAAWVRALAAKLKPSDLSYLWDKTMASAKRLSSRVKRGGKFRRNPQAVLMYEFNRRLLSLNKGVRDSV